MLRINHMHCATSRTDSGSIPSGVTGDFFRSYRQNHVPWGSGLPRNFFRGVQQIQLRTEDRENGDVGAVAPS